MGFVLKFYLEETGELPTILWNKPSEPLNWYFETILKIFQN